MNVICWFDDSDSIERENNKLRISNVPNHPNFVKVVILDVKGATMEGETIVDGYALIKAVQNAMNC